MWWIAFIVLAAVIGIVYLFLPLIKKGMANAKTKKTKDKTEKKAIKESIRQDKKNQKEQKKLEKQQAKQESEAKPEKPVKEEDPDLKIDNNNLDIDGFFNTDFNAAKEKDSNKDDILNKEYDDIFDNLFSNDRPSSKSYENDNDGTYDPVKESEIRDYLNDESSLRENKDIGKMIADLPPEIKALLLSDALDKKDY